MRDLFFAVLWLPLLSLNLVSASVGVLLWVWVALLSPNEMLYGFLAGVPFNKIVAIVTLGRTFVGSDKKDFYLDITLVLLVLFALAATVSWYNTIVANPTNNELYEKLIKEITLVFVIATVMTTRAQIDRLVTVIAITLGFFAVKEGLIFILTAGGHQIVGSGALGDNNGLAAALLMAAPLLYYLARHSVVRIVRLGTLAVLALSIVTIVATNSRGGFVGLVVLALFMVKNSRRFGTLLLVTMAGVVLYLMAPDAWFHRIDTINNAGTDTSFMDRLVAWKMSLLIALDHPLFGGGLHAVQNVVVWDTYKPFFSQVDFVNTPLPGQLPRAAHSIYFEVLGDLGFVGLTLFLAIVAIALRNCWWLYRTCRRHPSLVWAAELARMMQISLVVYLVTGGALSNGYYEFFYILVALQSRCRRIAQLALAAETAKGRFASASAVRPAGSAAARLLRPTLPRA